MKKYAFYFGIVAILCACTLSFSACSNDDELDSSMEGTWRQQFVSWSYYTKGGSVESLGDNERTYDDDSKVITISSKDGKYTMTSTASGMKGTFLQVSGREFQGGGVNDPTHRIIVKSVSGNVLTLEFYENYYRISDGERKEYGLVKFVKL